MNAVLLMLAAHLAVMSSEFGSNIQLSEDVWSSFKQNYNKQYSSVSEEALRRQVVAYNAHKYDKFNRENPEATFRLGINHLSDLSDLEFKNRNGYKSSKTRSAKLRVLDHEDIERMMSDRTEPIPDQLDWRTVEGIITEVKDQGGCGSCWAFSTTGLLEGQQKAQALASNRSTVFGKSDLIPLSEQEIIDCDNDGTDQGCYGGTVEGALEFINKRGGLESEDVYPYIGVEEPCLYDETKGIMKNKGLAVLKTGDEELLKKTVATYGPVSVAIDSTNYFQGYVSGVLDDDYCTSDPESLNHAVLVVGYGTSDDGKDYWLVKNSWGKFWGEEGYLKMSRNKKNQCGITTDAVIATF